METVVAAVVVCALMALIKKFKPNLSPKAEVGVRLGLPVATSLVV